MTLLDRTPPTTRLQAPTRPLIEHPLLRLGLGLLVLGVLVRELGTGPFLDGLRAIHPWSVAAALLLTAGTTWCCAKRWSLIAARHGESLPMRTAYVAYYRSQLINATLPGGVVGDLHRGVRHGWRAVLWERGIGQLVQIALVGTLLIPGSWRWPALVLFVVIAAAAGAVVALSALSTTGHLLIFLIAAQAAGVDLPLTTLVPIGALVLLGAAIPFNIAGWGPREGVAAWVFTTFGSSAAAGLTVSVTFGTLATLATLPGLLALGRRHV
jgi:hypothetical protein